MVIRCPTVFRQLVTLQRILASESLVTAQTITLIVFLATVGVPVALEIVLAAERESAQVALKLTLG